MPRIAVMPPGLLQRLVRPSHCLDTKTSCVLVSFLPLSPFPLSGLFKRFLPGDEPSLRVLCARSRDEHAAFGSAVADFDVSIAYANVIVEHVPKDVSVADLRSVHPDAQQLFAGAK